MTGIIELIAQTTGCCTPASAGINESEAEAISADFQVFAHPVRVQLLTLLTRSSEDVCVCDLEAAVAVKQPTVSYHLKLLREAGLVSYERRGPWAYYRVEREHLASLKARINSHLDGWNR
ncbi:ArsR/SmtB family transcription factor [Herpetosiphon sp. NSE202]|uniref:ArsR/SmtB family transcription factor n=1 Tax=Herpetosiphon sp. NSE202 TaxID=3351349 RepID=UPI00362832A9